MRRAALKDLVKRFPDQIKGDLFTIPLLYSSSLYVLIDRAVIYLGEIFLAESKDDGCLVSLVGDDQTHKILRQYSYQNVHLIVRPQGTFAFEGSIKIKSFESVEKDRWDLHLKITQLGPVVKV